MNTQSPRLFRYAVKRLVRLPLWPFAAAAELILFVVAIILIPFSLDTAEKITKHVETWPDLGWYFWR